MSNTAICHISVALKMKFNREKGLRGTENFLNCNFLGICTELLNGSCFSRKCSPASYFFKNT